MRPNLSVPIIALVTACLLSNCVGDQRTAVKESDTSYEARAAHLTIPSGTSIEIVVQTTLSSEETTVGEPWNGVVITSRDGIPAGSVVHGAVAGVQRAHHGDRATLDIELLSITIAGRTTPVRGSMEAILAGSTRAVNLGASGGPGGAGETEGSVVLKRGTPITFTTREPLTVRQ